MYTHTDIIYVCILILKQFEFIVTHNPKHDRLNSIILNLSTTITAITIIQIILWTLAK